MKKDIVVKNNLSKNSYPKNNFNNTIFQRISIEKSTSISESAPPQQDCETNKTVSHHTKDSNPIDPSQLNIIPSFQDQKINDDESINGYIGYGFSVAYDKFIGRGSYGSLYVCTNEQGKSLAVKLVNMGKKGIPNILETSIMSSMMHPYLNRCHRILASETKLYIIQDLAISDLAHYTHRDKRNHQPIPEELFRWTYCLCQAVSALHNNNIIHADIKASNVLLYQDGSIKLTDFNLSVKKIYYSESFKFNVCTATHRPLECLAKLTWNESLDIWSLGCTLYEMAYGELLFPYQGVLEGNHRTKDKEKQKVKDKEAKIRMRNRSINAIIDWHIRSQKSGLIPSSKLTSYPSNPRNSFNLTADSNRSGDMRIPSALGVLQRPIDYIQVMLCKEFNDPEMISFNKLILAMLVVEPSKRLTINQITAHGFFNGKKGPVHLSIERPVNHLSIPEEARVLRYIHQCTENENVKNLALNIYRKCNDLNSINENIKATACAWIASKILLIDFPLNPLSLIQLQSAEREICHNLSFRLHS